MMNWKPVADFDDEVYGSDAMLFRFDWGNFSLTTVYGWYDDSNPDYPWRFVDCHDRDGPSGDHILTNGSPTPPVEFLPLSEMRNYQ